MFRNYFLTAFRNFKKNKTYSFLNILGLGIGLASCMFVFTIIRYEYSFDNWHQEADQIYRVVRHNFGENGLTEQSGSIPYPSGDKLIQSVPDFEKVIQFHGPTDEKVVLTDVMGNLQVFRENKVLYTDPNFFEVMDFNILKGADQTILNEPYKVFVSERLAKKYYGDQNPIGQVITMNDDEQLEIVGIVENCPKNTNLPYEMIVSISTARKRWPDVFTNNWSMTWAYSTYVTVPKGADLKELENKLEGALEAHMAEDRRTNSEYHLQPLKEIHNDERYGDGNNYVTPSLMIWAFIILGSLVLGTACLNFINLSTAQAIKRAKEVGIRKTLGSRKLQLIGQFLSESLIIVGAAMIIGLTLGQVMISKFNDFLKGLEYNLSYTAEVFIFGLLLVLLVTFLAGFYPAMILSGYKPVDALTNKINIKKGSGNFSLRRVLVITQFAFTNLMLITTIIIASQMNYIKSKDLGFADNNVVIIDLPNDTSASRKALMNRFLEENYVLEAVRSFTAPLSGNVWSNSYTPVGEEYKEGNNSNMKFGDVNYLDFYDIPLVHGRLYNPELNTDSTLEAVVNRQLIATLGWTQEQALGKWLNYGNRKMKIVGIIENFHASPLQRGMEPVTLAYDENELNQLCLQLSSTPDLNLMSNIERVFRSFYPEELFECSTLKENINDRYMLEDLLHQIIQFVSLITILLSAMGLYGLVSFMANKNAKTIGIRKVFGASVPDILNIFMKEYVLLLLFAFLLAAPAAWWLSSLWLDEFSYRINVTAVYFLAGFALSVVIAILTVGYKSYQAATNNPIKSLRYE